MRRNAVSDVDLSDRVGEVIGLAGLLGSGRTETARLLFGIDRPDKGEMRIDGRPAIEQSEGGDRAAVRVHAGGSQDAGDHSGFVGAGERGSSVAIRDGVGAGGSARKQKKLARRWIKTLGIATAMRRRRSRTCRAETSRVILARWLASIRGC